MTQGRTRSRQGFDVLKEAYLNYLKDAQETEEGVDD